jgi:NO-binding membrane sensor protein with MHYT domain
VLTRVPFLHHYIGNRATILLDGEPEVQIAYSVGVTVASFFVPIVVLMLAFFVVTITDGGNSNRVSWWRVGTSGTLSGGAICGMHYLGNASISNYRCDYRVPFVVGSVIIAAAASTVALSLFFVFKSSWTNSWWKRIGCAVVMAGAVSGMHWCAVMGTMYTLTRVHSTGGVDSRNTTVIVTACLVSVSLVRYSPRRKLTGEVPGVRCLLDHGWHRHLLGPSSQGICEQGAEGHSCGGCVRPAREDPGDP